MAFGRLVSGLTIAAMLAAAPATAQTAATAPQPQTEQISGDAQLRGSSRLFAALVAIFTVAFLMKILFDDEDSPTSP